MLQSHVCVVSRDGDAALDGSVEGRGEERGVHGSEK
jgi:hypothetical protein